MFDHRAMTILVDELTATIQKRMHASGVISWYHIRSTLVAMSRTCTKCRLFSFITPTNVISVTH